MTRSNQAGSNSNRILVFVVVASLLLIALSTILSITREEKIYSSATPEGVVQLYLKAIIDGKNDQAASYFLTGSKCDSSDIDRAYISETIRVNLISTSIEGEYAYVKIDANMGSNGPFEDGYTESHTYRLKKESGNWRIEGIPWPLWDCGSVNK